MMFAGVNDTSWSGFAIFLPAMALVIVTWWLASPFTLRHARLVQKVGEFMMWPFNALTEWWDPNSQLAESDISPYFWPNGTMPKSAEFDALVAEDFKGFALRVGGLVEAPRVFSYAELRPCRSKSRSQRIFAFRDGLASRSGAAFRCVTSSNWCA
jgi:sulfoxide reductase catalytic subunit YedY